jgi:hypothetical protein
MPYTWPPNLPAAARTSHAGRSLRAEVVVQDVETQFDPTYEGHFGVARHFRLGSYIAVPVSAGGRLESGEQPKQLTRNLTFGLRLPELRVLLPWMAGGRHGKV